MWYGQEGQRVQNLNASFQGGLFMSSTYLQYVCKQSAKFQRSVLKTGSYQLNKICTIY